MRRLLTALLLTMSVALLAAACGSASRGNGILATTPLWAEVTSTVACGHPVESLIPIGADPHGFEPSLSDRGRLDAALLLVATGGNLEGGLDDTLSATPTPVHHIVRDGADPHVWLDPRNAAAMTRIMVIVLANADPANAALYRRNGAALLARLGELEAKISQTLEPVTGVSYLTFHDAFGYFENRFGLRSAGAVAVAAARPPGAKRISALRRLIRTGKIPCVFTEPEFEPALARTLIEGTKARIGILDPLGAGLTPGPGLYADLMRGLARSLKRCLKGGP